MANFCLPKELTSKFLSSLKDESLDPVKLSEMDSEARRAAFASVVGDSVAKDLNTAFESKLLLKNQQTGILNWAKAAGGLKLPEVRDLVAKIGKMDKLLSPEDQQHFLADLAAKKLGTQVTLEEATNITDLTKKAQAAKAIPTDNLSGVSDEYLKAANDLRNYINSLKPVSAIKSIGKDIGAIARNDLLMNPSTPLKTSVGQIVNSAMDYVSRRLANFSLTGGNHELVSQANKEAWQTFRKTGDNTASMESVDDVGKLGEGSRFDVPNKTQSNSAVVRGIGNILHAGAKISNKIAIDWEHNIPFTKFYQKTFFDAGNILSSNIAKSEGLSGQEAQTRSAEIFKDSVRLKPQTDVGAMVRAESQKQAARVTSTNKTYLSRLSIGIKDAINKAIPGLGDALVPIASIPANIIANGIENAGLGIPLGAVDMIRGRIKMGSEDIITKQQGLAQFSNGFQKLARTVGVLGAAAYIASNISKQDFKSDSYGGNYVKIGNTWVNMEYISAISPALAGMMYAKKGTGNDLESKTAEYSAGALSGLKNTPGVNEASDLITSITNSNYAKGVKKYADQFFSARGEPAFIKQLSGPTPIKGLFFSTTGLPSQTELKKLGAK